MRKLIATALLSAMLESCWALPLGFKIPAGMEQSNLDSLIGSSREEVTEKIGVPWYSWREESRLFYVYDRMGVDRGMFMLFSVPLFIVVIFPAILDFVPSLSSTTRSTW